MSQILVRNLNPGAVRVLKARAKAEKRSLQSVVKDIVDRRGVGRKILVEETLRSLREIRRRARPGRSPDSVQLIREDRDR